MNPPVRAVIFDWGGTLTPWHTVDVPAIWRQTYADLAHPDDEAAASDLAQILSTVDAAASATGRIEHRSARLEDILATAAHQAGLTLEHLDTAAARTAYEAAWAPYTITDPAVLSLWTWLRERGLAVGVLSNTIWSRDYHRGLFARDGVLHLIDADVYSSELDYVKPHPETFAMAAAAIGIDPVECVYVGDRLYEDVWGPQRVGLKTIHVPHSAIPADQLVDTDATPDAVAHDLADVAGIVTGWIGHGSQAASSADAR